jgi:oligopeptide/dipeptide ABC transporter ATP-binding protein
VALLSIRDLRVDFATSRGTLRAVDDVSLDVLQGECLGIVGESGSGKSVTFLSVLGLARGGRVCGSIRCGGRELTALPPAELRALRGREIAITLQDALTALNPALTIGTQIEEALLAHAQDLPARSKRRAARDRAIAILRLVGLPAAERRLREYPHQLSGGMRQRVMIAVALCCRPKLLIADEPTTALDVTIQAQVLELIADIRRELGMSVVLITHDLGVVAQSCDRVAVFYAGQVVESGPVRAILDAPAHPYTRGLLASIPRLPAAGALRPIAGQVPELANLPAECRFLPRCSSASDACGIRSRCARSGRDERHVAYCLRQYLRDPAQCRRADEALSVRSRPDQPPVRPPASGGPSGRRRRLRYRTRRDARTDRRERLREIDPWPHHPTARGTDCRTRALRRHRSHGAARLGAETVAPAHADRVPEPVCLAEPASHCR